MGLRQQFLVAALLLALSMKGLHMARKQKNELGTMVGYAGGLFFLFMTLLNILMSVGILPGASSFLPLISSGGSNLFSVLYGVGAAAQCLPVSESFADRQEKTA